MSEVTRREIGNDSTDDLLARFGHSTTYIGGNIVVLFGGAIGFSGKYTITKDTYIYHINKDKWTKLESIKTPDARAAHAACCVDKMQMVIFGGATGGGQLSEDSLHLLDLKNTNEPQWMPVPLAGITPGRRYGHIMNYSRPNLIVFGGNSSSRPLNDVWCMDVEASPFSWYPVKFASNSPQPPPRVYASSDIIREGVANTMLVVFGGRGEEGGSLNDLWGLRKHRNGQWDWLDAPTKDSVIPEPRFQHVCVAQGRLLIVLGGRSGSAASELETVIYDTELCKWDVVESLQVNRYRHSYWKMPESNTIQMIGGFSHKIQNAPTKELLTMDLDFLKPKEESEVKKDAVSSVTPGYPAVPDANMNLSMANLPSSVSPTKNFAKVKLSPHIFTKVDAPNHPDFGTKVTKVDIERLEDEGRKLRKGLYQPALCEEGDKEHSFEDSIIKKLLRPNITPARLERDFDTRGWFCLSWDEIYNLCRRVIYVLRDEEVVLKLRAPIKVYGDIHGQYYDLMRLFGSYKTPVMEDYQGSEEAVTGDLDFSDYLFIGDFVDRGTHSLEVICLLFALKVRYPQRIHMLRGNHEDPIINAIYGFKEECQRRLQEETDDADSCYARINQVFEYLPLGAVIEDQILCLHGGIGGSIQTIADIENLKRPIKVAQIPVTEAQQMITDILWSDPTDHDACRGVTPNEVRDPDGSGHIVKFGPDRVVSFLQQNNLEMIIRAHECVMDGFERFAGGRLITVFSATDYCGSHKNAGALLFIRRDLTIIPKVIYPQDRETQNVPSLTWIQDPARPPTPPRNLVKYRKGEIVF